MLEQTAIQHIAELDHQIMKEFVQKQAEQIAKDLGISIPKIRFGKLPMYCNGQYRPENNEIVLSRDALLWFTASDLINLLAHEIRHYWQCTTNILDINLELCQLTWEGSVYEMRAGGMSAWLYGKDGNTTLVSYEEFPWEHDANNYAVEYVSRIQQEVA